MNGYLLDTHVWLWVQSGHTQKFDARLRQEMEEHQRHNQLYISAISVLELARLVALQQYALPSSIDDFVADATEDNGFVLLDLTPRILIESTRLPGDLHRDPSDRILIATAREHGLTLLTRDKPLLRYSKLGHFNARKL